MKSKLQALYALEQLSHNNTGIHRLHPMVKLFTTLMFIAVVASFGRYDFADMSPFVFYPTICASLCEIPHSMLLRRVAVALPFCLFAGLSNVITEQATAFMLGSMRVSFGWVALFTILLRAYLCVSAVLILIANTPFMELTNQMRRLKVPSIFVAMFEMTYRYIGVLADESGTMLIAYKLRSAANGGLSIRHMGSFVGQLLLRSFDRAERIYSAMKCRGYALRELPYKRRKLSIKDWGYMLSLCTLCAILRFADISGLVAQWMGGLL